MDDDFNTPEALAAMFELAREINRLRSGDAATAAGLAAELKRLGGLLGVLQHDPEAWLRGEAAADGIPDEEVEKLVQQRLDAKAERNWGEADRIRDELKELGILLEDGASGTSWRRS